MGLRADIRDELRKETATKIHGQPTDHDVTLLEKELIAIAAPFHQHSEEEIMAMQD